MTASSPNMKWMSKKLHVRIRPTQKWNYEVYHPIAIYFVFINMYFMWK